MRDDSQYKLMLRGENVLGGAREVPKTKEVADRHPDGAKVWCDSVNSDLQNLGIARRYFLVLK